MDDLLVHRQEFGLFAAFSQELDWMNHKTHMYLMVGLVVGGGALYFSGLIDGGALFLLWPLACVAMMLVMMWAMGSMWRRPVEHTHDDGVSHSHGDVPEPLRKWGCRRRHRRLGATTERAVAWPPRRET